MRGLLKRLNTQPKLVSSWIRSKNEDGKYANLKEIIFIAISDSVLFPEKSAYKSDHILLDKDSHEHDLKDFIYIHRVIKIQKR